MSHFKVKMHQIRFLMSVRLSVQTEFDTYYTASKKQDTLFVSPYLKDVATLPCKTVMFNKAHKFTNMVLKNVVLKIFLRIYLLDSFFVKLKCQKSIIKYYLVLNILCVWPNLWRSLLCMNRKAAICVSINWQHKDGPTTANSTWRSRLTGHVQRPACNESIFGNVTEWWFHTCQGYRRMADGGLPW